MKRRSNVMSKQYCVWMNCAPGAIFFASRRARCSIGATLGFSAAPSKTRGAKVMRPTALEVMLVAHFARDLEQRHGVEVENGLGLRMIAGLHAVTRQAQHIADAHRCAAQDVALDRDAVPVATRNLHDGCVTDPRQQRADREARHVTVRAAAVRRIDRVDVAFEHARAAIDLFRIRRIRRRELGRDRERPRAQHALETPG
jgi:hypothetical protein